MPHSKRSYAFQVVGPSNVDALAEPISAFRRAARQELRQQRQWHGAADERLGPRYWRWCCVENPAGRSASVVALRDGCVVGMLANVYVRFRLAGRRVMASVVGDLSILEPERSWRCYVGLVEESLARAVADRVTLGYCFVIRASVELVQRMGGARVARPPVFAGVLDVPKALQGGGVPRWLSLAGGLVQPLVRLRRGGAPAFPRGTRGLEIRRLEGPYGRPFDELWGAVAESRGIAAVRDAAYLNWRYVKCPDREYTRLAAFRSGRPEGLVVFRSSPKLRAGYLLELYARDDCPAVLRALLESALELLGEDGIGMVGASFPAGSGEAGALIDLGFQRWASRLWGTEFIVITDRSAGACPELDPSNWYFSLGDWFTH